MANVKNLKKDINYVLGDIIEAVYLFEISTTGKPTTETNDLIDEAIAAFDALITKVNAKKVENRALGARIMPNPEQHQCRCREIRRGGSTHWLSSGSE